MNVQKVVHKINIITIIYGLNNIMKILTYLIMCVKIKYYVMIQKNINIMVQMEMINVWKIVVLAIKVIVQFGIILASTINRKDNVLNSHYLAHQKKIFL